MCSFSQAQALKRSHVKLSNLLVGGRTSHSFLFRSRLLGRSPGSRLL